jgi:threonine dehydrogenase-like Zn-dependent dehydrogenase/predicted NBD/HSP70 family sugar kinase
MRVATLLRDAHPEGVIAFDIGGTWFRSGFFTPGGQLCEVTRTKAVNFKSYPELTVPQMQQALTDYLVGEVRRLSAQAPTRRPRRASISMGAALDGRTGYIWNSGPLWGPQSKPFDLAQALRAQAPDVHWLVVNDVTAALMWHVARASMPPAKATLITVSSGIGARTWDGHRRVIPLDPVSGTQGEIGHLSISFHVNERRVERSCDCGGPNHLNAFCSGSGIERLLPLFADAFSEDYQSSSLAGYEPSRLGFAELIGSAQREERFAARVLETVTLPLAEILLTMLTLDPEVDRIILTGGVVHSLAPHYMVSLLRNLERLGLYQISDREPRFFQERLYVGQSDDMAGLLGAALMMRMSVEQASAGEPAKGRSSEHRALIRDRDGRVVSALVSTPRPGPDDVLIRMQVAGICGTDLQILRGDRSDPAPILGHEGLGEVVDVGEHVEGLHAGDVVTFNPTNPRDQDRILGHTMTGLFQEYVVLSRPDIESGMVERINGELLPALGVLIEPLASVLYSQELIRQAVSPETVVLFGAGVIGMLYSLTLQIAGVRRVYVVHPREGRRRWALEQGLVAADRLLPAGDGALARVLEDTGGLGVDAAILCTPRTASLDALRTALQLIRAEGCIDLFGGVPSGSPLAELPDVDLASIRRGNSCGAPSPGCHARTQTRAGRPIVLTGHRGAASRHIHAATALLQQHPQLFGKLITHVVSVDAAASMLRLHAESGARRYVDQEWVKVAIDFRRGGYSIEVSPHKPTKTAAGWRDV